MDHDIIGFFGKYHFLSNFYTYPVVMNGETYPTSEHAFQASKAKSEEERAKIRRAVSPARAKWLGSAVKLPLDWNTLRFVKMTEILRVKFTPGSEMARLLLATGASQLIEENWWGDTFWGSCSGIGTNHLGRLLMEIREELRA